MARYVILGNGAAGTTAAENIRRLDKDGSITILTDEDKPFYYRLRLNEFLAGEQTEEDLIAKKPAWYKDLAIDLFLDNPAVSADADQKIVTAADDRIYPYDRLLVATGSHAFVPPIAGSSLAGVFALRSLDDARRISAAAQEAGKAVLIGGGLLGLEAGNALRKRGLQVTVVEFFPRLLPRQLDEEGAGRLQETMEGMGFRFRLGAKTREIAGGERARQVLLESGEALEADMVIISAGVRPNLDIAGTLGLDTDKGIKVDEYLRTSKEGVFAAGDVAQFGAMPYGIWTAAKEQGRAAGINMAGGEERYHGTTMANVLKVVGIDLASAGEIDVEGRFDSRVVQGEGLYKKIVFEGGSVIGCIMLGDKQNFAQITRLIAEKKDVTGFKDDLLLEGFDFKQI